MEDDMTITKIEFEGDTQEPVLDLRPVPSSYLVSKGLIVEIGICAAGIEATRRLTLQDLIDMREWLDEAIADALASDAA